MICQDFDQLFYPILNAVRISQDFDQLSTILRKAKDINMKNVIQDERYKLLKHIVTLKRNGIIILIKVPSTHMNVTW